MQTEYNLATPWPFVVGGSLMTMTPVAAWCNAAADLAL